MKKWTVYQVKNRINGRLYIGVHKTNDPNDDYMGSGKLIKFAIAKHGKENFEKEVLLVTEKKEEAFELEKSLVTIDRIASGELYNLKEGGEGGWDWCNSNIWKDNRSDLARHASKASVLARNNSDLGAKMNKRSSERLTLLHQEGKIRYDTFLGKTHSLESKMKISEKNKLLIGNKNSQYGSIWITDGMRSKKIQSIEDIPEGWRKGRKISKSRGSS